MIDDVRLFPHQVGDALWRIESAGVPVQAGPLAVIGPGGALAGAVLGTPVLSEVRDGAFVLCASYSGNDEDALAGFAEAGARGCPRAVACTAGELAARARDEGVPVIGVPGGMPPDTAIVYFVLAALWCARGPSVREEAEAAVPSLLALASDDSGPRALAASLRGRTPVIHGEPAVASRWLQQVESGSGPPREVDLDALGAPAGSALERVLWLVLYGDLVAAHMRQTDSP